MLHLIYVLGSLLGFWQNEHMNVYPRNFRIIIVLSVLMLLSLSPYSASAGESVECEITRDRCLVRVCREIKVDCGENLIGYLSNGSDDKFVPESIVFLYRDRIKNTYVESSPLRVPEDQDVRPAIATLVGYNQFMFKQADVKQRFDPSEIGIVKRATIDKDKLLPLLFKDQRGDSQMYPPAPTGSPAQNPPSKSTGQQ
ncbi:MAG: hypothetical protein H6624_04325 [Bdellovibrionaceae bacterium]|nr:hypothetical protein [Bdellovibrionales bacterium]MCB9083542.1 hypothetical protein [Pseudobdellovibrionaceae bacterium]